MIFRQSYPPQAIIDIYHTVTASSNNACIEYVFNWEQYKCLGGGRAQCTLIVSIEMNLDSMKPRCNTATP